MKNIQEFIDFLKAEKERAAKADIATPEYYKYDKGYYRGMEYALSYALDRLNLLLKTDTGAITGKLPLRKHDVSGSAASEETSNVGNGAGNFLGETRPVSGNERTKEHFFCQLADEYSGPRCYVECERCKKMRLDASASEP